MSSTKNPETKTGQVKSPVAETTPAFDGLVADAAAAAASAEKEADKFARSSSVFSVFGRGAKKERKDDEERGERSGSAKFQRCAAAAAAAPKSEAAAGEEAAPESDDVRVEPAISIMEKVETKTNEESEHQSFKMRARLFRFIGDTIEWKEHGTGDVRLLKHKDDGKTRLVMRRDNTLKVCANHYIGPEMMLYPNVSSDRSWVWNAAADISEGDPKSVTFALRFANSENAKIFKDAFNKAQLDNVAIVEGKEEREDAGEDAQECEAEEKEPVEKEVEERA